MVKQKNIKAIRPIWRIAFFMLLCSYTISAQKYYFEQYSVSEGLAQSSVYSIVQDTNNIYWIGTQAGISTFDGIHFKNYTAEDGLCEGGVRTVFIDKSGALWFGHTGGGISRFKNGSFEVFEDALISIKSTITSISQDVNGDLWVCSEQSGVALISNPDAAIDSLKYELFLGRRLSDRVFSSFVSETGNLYFVTDLVVKFLNREDFEFENLLLNGVSRYSQTTCILEDTEGDIWQGKYNGGLFRFMPERDTAIMFDLVKAGMSSNWVSELFEDKKGRIWIGTWGGGVAYINDDGELQILDRNLGLPGSKIWQITEDHEGNILFGTNEHGLCVYKGDQFTSYSLSDGLIDPHVWAIEEHRPDEYWLGTNSGISLIKESNGRGEVIDFVELQKERIRFIKKDLNGKLWIAVQDEGIYTYSAGKLRYIPQLNRNISLGQITGMAVDSMNNLWAGTLDGLIYYEINTGGVDKLTQSRGLLGNAVSAVFVDSKQRIWVGIEGKGITIIDGTEFSSPSVAYKLSPMCFSEDKEGQIWMGTKGHGVYAIDHDDFSITKHLTMSDGLQANLINLLVCGEDNSVYIGTNKGLDKYNQREDKIETFNRQSGFNGIETKPNATLIDGHGNIWFGTDYGVAKLNPYFSKIKNSPVTQIHRLMVNYEPVKMEQNMSFSHRENSFIFNFRSITLNPEAMDYKMMLEGIDMEWRDAMQLQVNYPALPPGKYSFMVKAKNADGIWSENNSVFSFTIRPPFYLTWWFILSLIVLIIIVFFIYVKIREQALVRENKVLENKVQLRTAEVVAQKEELAQKNKDITDSINYAKRIQFALLPPEPPFSETFVLFRPKDIISGDFYWFSEKEGKEFIAAVDCTGHGVPGALMSMIGHSSLNKLVNQNEVLKPSEILGGLNKEVVNTLMHSRGQTDVMDGMDMSLIAYDKERSIIEYAGAYNSLYLLRRGELIEYKADKQAIGRTEGIEHKSFTNNEIAVEAGDMVYLFSDGYADQFGGELMKKFKPGRLRKLFLSIYEKSVEEQREILTATIEEWMGNIEQVDDILVIGRRF